MKAFLEIPVSFLKRHRALSAAILIGVVGGGYYFFSYKPAQEEQSTETLETAVVKRGDIRMSVTGSGQVYAGSRVDLKPVAAGDAIEVLSVHVKNDQEVKKDDLIAVLDTRDAGKAVRDAELSLRAAEIKMRQTEKLYESRTEDDKLARQTQEVALAQARNRLADAREDFQDYSIRAPFDGVVTGLSIAAGDSVSRDDAIASVITKGLYAEIILNEVDAASVRIGNVAELSFDALGGRKVSGTVTKVDTIGTVEQNVVSYDVEIGFDSAIGNLKPGMSTDVEILIEEKQGVLLVPNAAVKTGADGKYVLVPKTEAEIAEMEARASGAETARKQGSGTGTFQNLPYRAKPVETGIAGDVFTEIVSGLSEGDVVVTQAPAASSGTGSGAGTRQGTGSSSLIPVGAGAGTGMRLH